MSSKLTNDDFRSGFFVTYIVILWNYVQTYYTTRSSLDLYIYIASLSILLPTLWHTLSAHDQFY